MANLTLVGVNFDFIRLRFKMEVGKLYRVMYNKHHGKRVNQSKSEQ